MRALCKCQAYPFPHRTGSGGCRGDDTPSEVWEGVQGKNVPTGCRRRSAIRRRLIGRYGWHPIRDRAKIMRWLPKLYIATCRRQRLPYPERWYGCYIPAMRCTGDREADLRRIFPEKYPDPQVPRLISEVPENLTVPRSESRPVCFPFGSSEKTIDRTALLKALQKVKSPRSTLTRDKLRELANLQKGPHV